MTVRVLAVLAAIFLVSAFAMLALLPPTLTLGQGLLILDHRLMATLTRQGWWWEHVALPVLLRPVWLLPAETGLVLGGIALSLTWRRSPDQRQRRS